MMLTQTYDAYRFGSALHLSERQMRGFIHLFERKPQPAASVLEGRNPVSIAAIDGIGSAAVKYYARGGLIRFIVRRRYLNLGKTRGQMEYELLQAVKSLGINAPEPIAYAYRGRAFYRAWLVTREINHPLSLARISLVDEKRSRVLMKSTVHQVSLLIEHGIYHVDLHPGNVVIDTKDRVFLVDFDKGFFFRGAKEKLRQKYLARWQRAVIKHRLPAMLGEMMRAGLYSQGATRPDAERSA